MTTPMPTAAELEPGTLPLDELRALRTALQHEDDAISYVRRLAQARLDLLRAELHHRAVGDDKNITGELPAILGTHLTGGPPRPPRPADDFSDHPLALALEELCSRGRQHRPAVDERATSWSTTWPACTSSSSCARRSARSCSCASTRSAPSWCAATATARPTSTACSPTTDWFWPWPTRVTNSTSVWPTSASSSAPNARSRA